MKALDHGESVIVINPKGEHTMRDEIVAGAVRAIARDMSVVIVDATRDGRSMRDQIAHAAHKAGRLSFEITAERPGCYRIPWSRLQGIAIAAIAVPDGRYGEPGHRHRAEYFVHLVAWALGESNIEPNLDELVRHGNHAELRKLALGLPEGSLCRHDAEEHLRLLTERDYDAVAAQLPYTRALIGSDVGHLFGGQMPYPGRLDLVQAITEKAVIYVGVERYNYSPLTDAFSAGIIQDLLDVCCKELDGPEKPALVAITGLAGVRERDLVRFMRTCRSAGIRLLLELSELSEARSEHPGERLPQGWWAIPPGSSCPPDFVVWTPQGPVRSPYV